MGPKEWSGLVIGWEMADLHASVGEKDAWPIKEARLNVVSTIYQHWCAGPPSSHTWLATFFACPSSLASSSLLYKYSPSIVFDSTIHRDRLPSFPSHSSRRLCASTSKAVSGVLGL